MAFPPSFLSELKSRCDIETIISTYIKEYFNENGNLNITKEILMLRRI